MLIVLCIDDDEQCLSLRKEVLLRAGFDVLTAADGQAGIALAKQNKIDSIVLDYSLPGMDGEEVARVLKQDLPGVPIILCSGWDDDLPEAVFKLVDAFVAKGDGVEFLISVIREVTTRKRNDSVSERGLEKSA